MERAEQKRDERESERAQGLTAEQRRDERKRPRKTLIISDALFISSATCTYFSIKPSLLLVGRFFFGLRLGIATLSCPLIIFETSAIKTRGTLIACNGLMMGLGSFLSYLFDIFDSGAPNIWRIKLGIIALPALLQVLLVAVLSMFSRLSKPCVEVSYPNCVSSLFFDSNLKNALAAAIFVQACTELTGIKYVTHLASDLELSFLPFLIISGSLIGKGKEKEGQPVKYSHVQALE
ncbi:uncharacterized protein LOC136069626 [Quercus suber]|uniref:uncharacterized protein LOC136069626 n=1 Tax=Quercus suber TaxID=58331 RepID=UPI0032DF23E3